MGNLLKTCFQTFWKLAQLLIFLLIVPPLINYASLKRETPVLMEHGITIFDEKIIQGKLFADSLRFTL